MKPNYMQNFRDARKAMGFVHSSAYIPANRVNEFSLYVDRLKADRMLEICETCTPTSRERIALAGRNLTDLPSVDEVKSVLTIYPNNNFLKRAVAALVQKVEDANAALNVARQEEEEEDRVKWMSKAVAVNHDVNVSWRELVRMMTTAATSQD